MLSKAAFLLGILLSSTLARAETGSAAVREHYVAARRQVDVACRDQFAAQTRLTALKAEQRFQSALTAAPPLTIRQNPEYVRIQADVRSLELQVRKLSERLAPAHPELITAEAELEAARQQLANIPETIAAEQLPLPTENRHATEAAANIERAEHDLHRAEDRLSAALDMERHALADLLTSPPAVSTTTPKAQSETTPSSQQQNAGWILAGIAGAAVLLFLIASGARSEMAPDSIHPATAPAPSVPGPPTSRRLVYSASGEKPTPTPPATKTRRAPIIPRRRVG